MQEEWRDVVGYDGRYQISNLGRVKSIRFFKNKKQYIEKILKTCVNNRRYEFIILPGPKSLCIHRLVATAFLDNPMEFNIVNHKDANRSNNNVENLEWCTQEYNIRYSAFGCPKNKPLADRMKIELYGGKSVAQQVFESEGKLYGKNSLNINDFIGKEVE